MSNFNHALLTPEQERSLLVSYKLHKDAAALASLVEHNQRLIREVAKHYQANIPLDDLIQEGNIGLLVGIEKFDLNRNVRLSTYCVDWVKHTMRVYIRRNNKVENNLNYCDDDDYYKELVDDCNDIAILENGVDVMQDYASLWNSVNKLDQRTRDMITEEYLGDKKVPIYNICKKYSMSRPTHNKLRKIVFDKLTKELTA